MGRGEEWGNQCPIVSRFPLLNCVRLNPSSAVLVAYWEVFYSVHFTKKKGGEKISWTFIFIFILNFKPIFIKKIRCSLVG